MESNPFFVTPTGSAPPIDVLREKNEAGKQTWTMVDCSYCGHEEFSRRGQTDNCCIAYTDSLDDGAEDA